MIKCIGGRIGKSGRPSVVANNGRIVVVVVAGVFVRKYDGVVCSKGLFVFGAGDVNTSGE